MSRSTLRQPGPRKPGKPTDSLSPAQKGTLSPSKGERDGEKGLASIPSTVPAAGSKGLIPDSLPIPASGPALEFSLAGQKLTAHSGILELMDDLGRAMTVDPHMLMLGGGNPALVPELQALFRAQKPLAA